MSRIRKVVTKLNLNAIPVYIEDTKSYSDYFSLSQFDRYFTSGKNGFLITGTSYLSPNSEILLELLDSNGNPVFLNPITNYSEGGGRLVSIEVYENTPVGPGTLHIVGTARIKSTGEPIPTKWVDRYNVRWSVPVNIEPGRKNSSIIRFKTTPQIFATQRVSDKQIVTRLLQSQSDIQIPLQSKMKSALPYGYAMLPTSSLFTSDMLGGYVTGSIYRRMVTESISASISSIVETAVSCSVFLPLDEVLNSTRGFTNSNIYDTDGNLFDISLLYNRALENGVVHNISTITESVDLYKIYTDSILQSDLQIQYQFDSNVSVPDISNVFADLRIVNLNTLSGEVARIKTFAKEPSAQGDYYLIADTKPEPQDFFISGGVVDTGVFTPLSLPSNTWFADFSGSSAYYSGSVSSSITMVSGSTVKLLDGVTFNIGTPALTGSYYLGTQQPLLFFTGSEYTLSYDVYYAKQYGAQLYIADAELDVYLYGSGSAKNINITNWGLPIDTLSLANKSVALIQNREINFTVKQSGYASLRFLMNEGYFTLSNIRLKTAEEFGFNSDEVRLVVPVDAYASSSLIFKTEFYDINNNNVNIETLSDPVLLPPTSLLSFGSSSFAISASSAISASYADSSSYVPGVATVAFVINGGAYPVSTGFKGSVRMPTDVLLSNVGIYTSGSGSINIDIRKQDHATYEPLTSSPASIVGTPLSMSNDTKYLDTVLSGWTTILAVDDILNFFVLAVDGAELKVATVVFNIQR